MLQIQYWTLFLSLYVGTVYFQSEVSRDKVLTGLRWKHSLLSDDFGFHLRLCFILKDKSPDNLLYSVFYFRFAFSAFRQGL